MSKLGFAAKKSVKTPDITNTIYAIRSINGIKTSIIESIMEMD